MSESLITEPPRYPAIEGAEILEQLAKFLWEGITDYNRGIKWDDHNQSTKWHYRGRAARLLETFNVTPRWGGREQPVRTPDDFDDHYENDVLVWGSVLVRIAKPNPEYFGVPA